MCGLEEEEEEEEEEEGSFDIYLSIFSCMNSFIYMGGRRRRRKKKVIHSVSVYPPIEL